MGKIAFVFSGQGAQYAGMGRQYYEASPAAKSLFDAAETLRPGTLQQSFNGDKETLMRTENTQPCLYLAGLAAAVSLRGAGIRAEGAAGFSLGEIPALAFAGAFTYLEGFRIVCRRGTLMQKAAEEPPAIMAAVLRLDNAQVDSICENFENVFPVNYNCPGQVVLSGTPEGIAAVKPEIAAAGGKLVPIKVGGGFHSPYMDGAAKAFGDWLESAKIEAPAMTVYSNFTAKPYGTDVCGCLQNQINHPVRWEAIIRDMTAAGFDTFIEVGAGDTLTKLITRIAPEAKALAADSFPKIEDIKEQLNA
ncbi:MAG: ACP S-malonyltransferase [Clostridia bacterium]|nr:ACP S-malonyltransferase [Clostridia bacterium]